MQLISVLSDYDNLALALTTLSTLVSSIRKRKGEIKNVMKETQALPPLLIFLQDVPNLVKTHKNPLNKILVHNAKITLPGTVI